MTDTTIADVNLEDDTKPCQLCKPPSMDHTTRGHVDGGTPLTVNGHVDGGSAPVTVQGHVDGGAPQK